MKFIIRHKLKLFLLGTLSLLVLAILSFIVLFALPRPSFVIEPARPHFWDYPVLSDATYKIDLSKQGKIVIELQHPILKGVTPAMLSWWYQHLASGSAIVRGKEYSFYHLFHLSEHGQTKIISPPTDGTEGMGVGACVYRQERFGPYLSKGYGRVAKFSDQGFTVIPVMGPLAFGVIEHQFLATPVGSQYNVKIVLGSDLPLLGGLLNFYIREKQFPPIVVHEWIRHQVEEVGSLPHFLPQLYDYHLKHLELKDRGLLLNI